MSTLNFSFWIDEDPSSDGNNSYQRFYKNRLYHGYEAFCAALNQALDVRQSHSISFLLFNGEKVFF